MLISIDMVYDGGAVVVIPVGATAKGMVAVEISRGADWIV
jgi:hypothetical protein